MRRENPPATSFAFTFRGKCARLEAKGDIFMTFSEKLITLRAGRGWSQEKLAAELGVTRQAVGRWEKGVSRS